MVVGSHRSISDWEQLQVATERVIICDAKQLKTLRLLTCTNIWMINASEYRSHSVTINNVRVFLFILNYLFVKKKEIPL